MKKKCVFIIVLLMVVASFKNVFAMSVTNDQMMTDTTLYENLYVGKESVLTIQSGSTVEINGDIYVFGEIKNYGNLNVNGTIYCLHYNKMFSAGGNYDYGYFYNYGQLRARALNVKDEWFLNHTHDFTLTSSNAATCSTEGKKTYTCELCGYVKNEIIPINSNNHDWSKWTKFNNHQHQRVCKDNSEHVEKADHEWDDGTITVQPTCEKNGTKLFKCKNCSATKTETINKTDHKWDDGEIIKSPTCEEEGTKLFKCENCNTTKNEVVSKIGHKWDNGKVTTEPTCSQKGVKTYTCLNDASHIRTEKVNVNPDNHSWGEWTKLNNQQHQRVCKNNNEHSEKANHDWDDGVITLQATCNNEGVKTYTCQSCGERKNAAIAKTKHHLITVKGTPPTADSDGLTDGIKCDQCGEWQTPQQVISKMTYEEDSITSDQNKSKSTKKKKTVKKKLTKVVIQSVKNVKSKKLKVKWKKIKGVKKYQISYRIKGKKWVTKYVNSTSYMIKKLKVKKQYQIRIRGINGQLKGQWSKTKAVKIIR